MSKQSIECPVCTMKFKLKDSEPAPQNCPCCNTDMENKNETRKHMTECDYVRSTTKSDVGTLVLTDKRIFWVKERLTIVSNNLAALALTSVLTNKGANKLGFTLPLEQIEMVQETKKGLVGKTMTIIDKEGNKYQFQPTKKDLDSWKTVLNQYIKQ